MNDIQDRSGDPRAERRADHASGYAEAGDFHAAADLMRQALDHAPCWAAGWMALGNWLEAAGDIAGAVPAFSRALSIDPEDGQGAALKLASLGHGGTPATAPPAFVRGLFDQYAERFEAQLVGRLGYDAPAQMMAAITAASGHPRRFASCLDLGCGTGLMGERLRGLSDRLVGVDLSPKMLAKARAKAIYDRLVEADLLQFDPAGETFDLVTAADVLNYIGDHRALFAAVAAMMEEGGLFAFSVEATETDEGEAVEGYRLRASLRYAHSAGSVAARLGSAGLAPQSCTKVVIRKDRGTPVAGIVVVARRT